MSCLPSTLAMLLSSNIPPDKTDLDGGTIASVVITGISVVFIGLIILILLVTLYGKVFEVINAKADAKAKAKAEEEAKAKAAEAKKEEVKAAPAPAAPVVEDGIEEEVVAAIMGALSAMYAGSGKKPVLKGVKAVKPRRSAWSAAGVMDNTRPF
ncbi:OadG family transporter subunit [Ruminococcus sp.]|uniref:OadG family transporter subunit n=1 Tax=Ruminococcus sp. TaxID=41978 RepID=UPI0025F362F4|nr:OadG family transporter subunit [Ruminococcus sp.]MBQ8965842.1 OadG family protein [Ruminococcus sp.]